MKSYSCLLSLLVLLTSSFTLHDDVVSKNLLPGGAYAKFAGKFGGEITPTEIADHCTLTVDGCAKGSHIFTFAVKITSNGRSVTLKTDSNELTEVMHTELKKLSPGDSFKFVQMKAYLPNGKDVVSVLSRTFTVV